MPVPQMMRVSYQFSEKFMFQRRSERVAQAVEHVTFNHGVVGSSPTALTKFTVSGPPTKPDISRDRCWPASAFSQVRFPSDVNAL